MAEQAVSSPPPVRPGSVVSPLRCLEPHQSTARGVDVSAGRRINRRKLETCYGILKCDRRSGFGRNKRVIDKGKTSCQKVVSKQTGQKRGDGSSRPKKRPARNSPLHTEPRAEAHPVHDIGGLRIEFEWERRGQAQTGCQPVCFTNSSIDLVAQPVAERKARTIRQSS